MTHEQIQELLPDYCAGDLSADITSTVRSHLTGCQECQDFVIFIRFLERQPRDSGKPKADPHPNAREITDFALDEGDLDSGTRGLIARHVSVCETCREFVDFARQARDLPDSAGQIASESPMDVYRGRRRIMRQDFIGYAAAAAILIMLYPAYLGIREFGRRPRPFIAAESMVTLRDISLSDEIPDVVLDPVKPYFHLAIFSRHFAQGTEPGDRTRVTMVSSDGKDKVLDYQATYGQLANRDLRQVVTAIIPVAGRNPGEYVVRLENLDRPGVFYEARIKLVAKE